MALTTTKLSGALSADATKLTVAAYTAPAGRAKALLRLDDEICLVTDTSVSPTLGVVRGYMGTAAVAHSNLAAVEYGRPEEFQTSKGPSWAAPSLANPAVAANVQSITATGATGSAAAAITQPSPAFLTATGTSGAGINLPVPVAGAAYTIKNNTTGALLIYSVGATINGTTGTTAFSLSATGNLVAHVWSNAAGAWQAGGNT